MRDKIFIDYRQSRRKISCTNLMWDSALRSSLNSHLETTTRSLSLSYTLGSSVDSFLVSYGYGTLYIA